MMLGTAGVCFSESLAFKAMELDELIQGVSRYEKERGPRTKTWDAPTFRAHLEEETVKEIKK